MKNEFVFLMIGTDVRDGREAVMGLVLIASSHNKL